MAKIVSIQAPVEQKTGALDKVASFIGAKNLGEYTGNKLNVATGGLKSLDTAIAGQQETRQRIIDQIQKNRSVGQDTSRLEAALKQLDMSTGESTQARQGIAQGAVSGRQAIGSAIETASWIPMVGAATKVASAASKVGAARFAGQSIVKPVARAFGSAAGVEGAISGAMQGAGSAIQNEQAGVGDILGSTALGAGLGYAGGRIAEKAFGAAAGKAGTAFAKIQSPIEKRLAADAVYDFIKASAPSGKKTSQSFSKQYFGAEGSRTFSGLQGIFENAVDEPVASLTGQTKKFSLDDEDFFLDLPGALNVSKEKLANKAYERLAQVSDAGLTVDINSARTFLQNELKQAVGSQKRQAITNYLSEIEGLNDPVLIRKYMSELGTKSGPYIQTGTNQIEGQVAAGLQKYLEQDLDNFLLQNQAPISEIFEQLAGIKSVESDIIKMIQKELRKAGDSKAADTIGNYGLGVMLSAIPYGNALQLTKGAALFSLGTLKKIFTKDTAQLVKNSFEKVAEYYKKKGVSTMIPESKFMQKALPEPAVGAARSSVSNTQPIPVAPTGRAGVEMVGKQGIGDYKPLPKEVENAISSLPQETQDEARQLIQRLSEITGSEKKNLGEAGFSKLTTLLSVAGITGAGALATSSDTVTVEFPKTEAKQVSPAKEPEFDFKKEIAFRETGVVKGDKYKHKSKNKNGTYDLGKYAANTESLKAYGDDFLGRKVTEKEFLNSPDLQERFFEGYLKHMEEKSAREPRLKDPQFVMALWHRGFSDLTKERLDKLMSEEKTQKYINNKPGV